MIAIDNCDRPLDGDFLCSMLSQEMVQARILGKSERVVLPSNCVVIATGNNLILAGDISRRAVICRVDAKTERPDSRQFDFDPRNVAREHRAELVVAGLTILRAYISAGRPCKLPKIGSFEEWNIIREALVWIGRDDPGETRISIFESDPRKEDLAELLTAWFDCYGSKEKTLAQIRAEAEAEYCLDNVQRDSKKLLLFRLLIEQSGRPTFNGKSIGRCIKRHKDRVVGNKVLQFKGDKHGAKWWVAIEEPRTLFNTTVMQFPE